MVTRYHLNAICPYYTMFPLDFPLARLAKASPQDWVLDPFCGRGTTNFAARMLGLPSIGMDSNPVACAIARAKLAQTTPRAIVASCARILSGPQAPAPRGEFWRLCFHPQTLRQLMKVRAALLRDCRSEARIALRAIVLGALHGPRTKSFASYLSNQMPRTFSAKPDYAIRYWRARKLKPQPVDLSELVARRAGRYFRALPARTEGRIIEVDSRRFALKRTAPVRWIITSPPYYGLRTYVPDQWLRMWFLGGPAEVQYAQPSQFQHRSPDHFVSQLVDVWKRVATISAPDARLIVRFGGIHDRRVAPGPLLRESLVRGGWRVVTTRSARSASEGNRQAGQFGRSLGRALEEHDFFARLAR